MALFGSVRDVSFFTNIARELLGKIISQEILYYKIRLDTVTNIYGESLTKSYDMPVLINCLITPEEQVFNDDEFGPDLTRQVTFAFLRELLREANIVPEVGDIISWHDDYYEIHQVSENQYIGGKSNEYALSEYLSNFGSSFSITCVGHLTRSTIIGLSK